MISNGLIKPLLSVIKYAKIHVYRKYDSLGGDNNTRCENQQEYIKLYAGPEYPMYAN